MAYKPLFIASGGKATSTPVVTNKATTSGYKPLFLNKTTPVTKTVPNPSPVVKTINNPSLIGGAYYSVPGQPNTLVQPEKEKSYGTMQTTPGNERDHMVAWTLAGASTDQNLQSVPADVNQQWGVKEGQLKSSVVSGAMDLPEARQQDLTQKENYKLAQQGIKTDVWSNLWSGIKEVFTNPVKTVKEAVKLLPPLLPTDKGKAALTGNVKLQDIKNLRDFLSISQEELKKEFEKNPHTGGVAATKYGVVTKDSKGNYSAVDPFGAVGAMEDISKSAIAKIAKSVNLEEIKNVLQKTWNYAAEEAKILANELVKTKTPKEVATILEGNAPKIIKDLAPAVKEVVPATETIVKESVPATETAVAREVAATADNAVAGTERGFITSVKEALPNLAVQAEDTITTRSTNKLAQKAANLVRTDLAAAETVALKGNSQESVAVASELLKHYAQMEAQATDELVKNAVAEKASALANEIARKLTEQGRAVQAASILTRLTPEGQLKFAAREINKFNESIASKGKMALQKKIPQLNAEQTQHILSEMRAVQAMPDSVEKTIRFNKLQQYISQLIPSPFYKKVSGVWKAGLLTGIKTTGLNLASNVSHLITEQAKNVPAALVDKFVSLFTGKRTLVASLKGGRRGFKEGMNKAIRYMKTGYDERDIATKLDWKKVNYGNSKFAKAIQTYEQGIFRLLGAEDQPFYYSAKAMSMYNQAKAEAINKGLRGKAAQEFIDKLIASPTDEMIMYATNDAETAVFQNSTVLGNIAKTIQRAPGGEFVIPFGRTPSSVAMQLVNYSPVGIVKTIASNIGKGRFDQRLFAQGIGRGITGTAILYLGYQLYKKGLLTLGAPKDTAERELWKLQGKKANAIKIGNKWRSVNMFGPAGPVLTVGGYFSKGLKDTGSPTQAAVQAGLGGIKSLTEQTFLKGMSSLVDAISNPEQFGQTYLGSSVASFVPTLVSDIGAATDKVNRKYNTIGEYVQARIPGARNQLQPVVTTLGNEQARAGNVFETLADPSRPSNILESPVVNELARLQDAGFKVAPTLLGNKNGYESLTKAENTQLLKNTGTLINKKLSALFETPEYQALDDEGKQKAINGFVERAKDYTRAGAVAYKTKELTGDKLRETLKSLKASGLMTQSVYNLWLKSQ